MILYRTLLGIDSLVALVAVYFFVEGLGDGTVSSFNGLLWVAILAGVACVLGGGIALRRSGRIGAANLLLLVLALPAMLFVLGLGILLLGSGPHH